MPQGISKSLTYYPTYCWSASQTYNAWVKLSAADVWNLRRMPGSEAQRVWFLNNHPIRFVRLVGVVISFEEATGNAELRGTELRQSTTRQRPHRFTIDDGSGASLDVVLWRRGKDEEDIHIAKFPGELIRMSPLDFKSKIGRSVCGDIVDIECVEVGQVVKVKGWVDEYKNSRQIQLERVKVVQDTAEEAREWQQLALYQKDVLAKPWILTAEEVKALRKKSEKATRKKRKRTTRAMQKQNVDLLDPSQQKDEISLQARVHVGDRSIAKAHE